jgi:hypothetical protein
VFRFQELSGWGGRRGVVASRLASFGLNQAVNEPMASASDHSDSDQAARSADAYFSASAYGVRDAKEGSAQLLSLAESDGKHLYGGSVELLLQFRGARKAFLLDVPRRKFEP